MNFGVMVPHSRPAVLLIFFEVHAFIMEGARSLKTLLSNYQVATHKNTK